MEQQIKKELSDILNFVIKYPEMDFKDRYKGIHPNAELKDVYDEMTSQLTNGNDIIFNEWSMLLDYINTYSQKKLEEISNTSIEDYKDMGKNATLVYETINELRNIVLEVIETRRESEVKDKVVKIANKNGINIDYQVIDGEEMKDADKKEEKEEKDAQVKENKYNAIEEQTRKELSKMLNKAIEKSENKDTTNSELIEFVETYGENIRKYLQENIKNAGSLEEIKYIFNRCSKLTIGIVNEVGFILETRAGGFKEDVAKIAEAYGIKIDKQISKDSDLQEMNEQKEMNKSKIEEYSEENVPAKISLASKIKGRIINIVSRMKNIFKPKVSDNNIESQSTINNGKTEVDIEGKQKQEEEDNIHRLTDSEYDIIPPEDASSMFRKQYEANPKVKKAIEEVEAEHKSVVYDLKDDEYTIKDITGRD